MIASRTAAQPEAPQPLVLDHARCPRNAERIVDMTEDPPVRAVLLEINSSGGVASVLFDLVDAIHATQHHLLAALAQDQKVAPL